MLCQWQVLIDELREAHVNLMAQKFANGVEYAAALRRWEAALASALTAKGGQ
jgi:hypothetical protein